MYRARETFWAPENRRIEKGDLVAADDPVRTGREELFQEVEILRIPTAASPGPQQDDQDTPTTEPTPPAAEATGPGDDSATAADADSTAQPATAAAKKTVAKKTTTARQKTGGDQ